MPEDRPINWQIGVGDPDGHHSAVYKIKATKKQSSFYVMMRELGKEVKATFHPSGKRHVGFTEEHKKKMIAEGSWTLPDRHFDEWIGGTSVRPGLSLEYVLRFPVGQLRRHALSPKERATFWVPAPPPLPDQVLDIRIYLADQPRDFELTPMAHHSIIASQYLADGRALVLITKALMLGPPPNIAERALDIVQDARKQGITPENVRADQRVLIGFNIDQIRGWTEYALDTFLPPALPQV
jgi:hypothetical protein